MEKIIKRTEYAKLLVKHLKHYFNNEFINDHEILIGINSKLYSISGISKILNESTIILTAGEEIKTWCEDIKPDNGEYFESRGISDGLDLAGFIASKEAGERILRFIKYILNTDNPKSWLDYREYEPTWIQFKFRKEEFDLQKLDSLVKANNNILTEEILKSCILK